MKNYLMRLEVWKEHVSWRLYDLDFPGPLRIDGSDHTPLQRGPLVEKTITLLADTQQLVANMQRRAGWDEGLLSDMAERVVEGLGEQLFRFLFAGDLAGVLTDTLTATANGFLRIELEFRGDTQEYASWPWEYLRSPLTDGVPGTGCFLALCTQLVLNRTVYIKRPRLPVCRPRPRVLLIVADIPRPAAGDFGEVQAHDVISALSALEAANLIELTRILEPPFVASKDWRATASWKAFKKSVQGDQRPDVIHFIGHGQRIYDPARKREKSQLVFVGDDGTPDARDDTDFVEVVAGNPDVKLVFLQACESGVPGPHASATSVGRLLAEKNIPAVVAMQAKVKNVVANSFATAFYKSVSEMSSIDRAVRAGREAIREGSDTVKLAFGVPVLYLLQGHGALFTPQPQMGASSGARADGPGRDSANQPPPPKVELNIEICEHCAYRLTERERKLNACPGCGILLRCKECDYPYDRPTLQNFCGRCTVAVERRADVAVTTSVQAPQAASAIGSLVGVPAPHHGIAPNPANSPPKRNVLALLFPNRDTEPSSSGEPSS